MPGCNKRFNGVMLILAGMEPSKYNNSISHKLCSERNVDCVAYSKMILPLGIIPNGDGFSQPYHYNTAQSTL